MTDAVNLQLHVSFNGMTDSECEVSSVDKTKNMSQKKNIGTTKLKEHCRKTRTSFLGCRDDFFGLTDLASKPGYLT